MPQLKRGPRRQKRGRTPSSERRVRPRVKSESEPIDGPTNGPSNNLKQIEVFQRLKPLKGPTPRNATATITDGDNQLLYAIDSREDIGILLWVLKTNTMTWEHIPIPSLFREKSLPRALRDVVGICTAPLSGSKKLLLMGCSKKGDETKADKLFTFDPSAHEFAQENAGGELPCLTADLITETDVDRIICSAQKESPDDYLHYLWVYTARPFNIWKSAAPIGPFKGVVKYGVVVLGGKLCALLQDARKGSVGLNAYMELDDLIEDVQK